MKTKRLTKSIAIKIKETVECGLSSGLGKQIPGQMCIEAAVCYAYGLPHGDNPPCVGSAVRRFKIRLNDSNWSSNKARAEGMIEISIAQLNSNKLDQVEFAKRITLKTINVIIADLAHNFNIELEAKLRVTNDLIEARSLCIELRCYAAAAAAAYAAAADADAVDAAYAAYAAYAAADADAVDAAYAAYAAYAAAYAAADAAAAAADADADAVAVDAAVDAATARDNVLKKAAKICLEVLKEMKSEGCKYLYLLDKIID